MRHLVYAVRHNIFDIKRVRTKTTWLLLYYCNFMFIPCNIYIFCFAFIKQLAWSNRKHLQYLFLLWFWTHNCFWTQQSYNWHSTPPCLYLCIYSTLNIYVVQPTSYDFVAISCDSVIRIFCLDLTNPITDTAHHLVCTGVTWLRAIHSIFMLFNPHHMTLWQSIVIL